MNTQTPFTSRAAALDELTLSELLALLGTGRRDKPDPRRRDGLAAELCVRARTQPKYVPQTDGRTTAGSDPGRRVGT